MAKGIVWAVVQKPIEVKKFFPNGEPHHITLQYGVERDNCFLVGSAEFDAIATAICWNEKIQAILVRLPWWVPCCNEHPHISVSWCDGVAPVASNEMLKGPHFRMGFDAVIPVKIEFLEWESVG